MSVFHLVVAYLGAKFSSDEELEMENFNPENDYVLLDEADYIHDAEAAVTPKSLNSFVTLAEQQQFEAHSISTVVGMSPNSSDDEAHTPSA
jgi:hypothetical protein